jgi:hypothetical protein
LVVAEQMQEFPLVPMEATLHLAHLLLPLVVAVVVLNQHLVKTVVQVVVDLLTIDTAQATLVVHLRKLELVELVMDLQVV